MTDRPVLLPMPRSVDLGRARVPVSEPVVSWAPALPPQGYRLRVSSEGIRLAAADPAGVSHGRATLAQLTDDGTVPEADIEDWPDLPVRGFMLDVSRDKVPTVAQLESIVDLLAAWKMNHFELYTEHTFAYAGHEEVWRDASPLTPEEVDHLDAYCAERQVELTANQNCLGHMERWLSHARYKSLAIHPDCWQDPRGRWRPATTMEPENPAALALARDLLGQLLPHFRSRRAHVGLDEPWELPPERSPAYLDYLRRLRDVPELDGRQALVWGDILAVHPELIPQLPEGVTVCEWGYEADHPFAARAEELAGAGVPFWLCPGTSSWNSVVGRFSNARANCQSAAEVARAAGASGYLVTDWGDYGHLQPWPVSLPGLAVAASVSWCAAASPGVDIASALDRFCFGAEGMGRAALELGDAHLAVEPQVANMASLMLHVYHPQARVGSGYTEGLTSDQLDRAVGIVDDAVARLAAARPAGAGGVLMVDELSQAAALFRHACEDARARLEWGGSIAGIPEGRRRGLAGQLEELADRHRQLWLARNRPGGMEDSAARLHHLADCYRKGEGTRFQRRWLPGPGF
ncbi:MAG TPA: family 20 glycosylhydrolase [Acidimicrobiales bacterium]|nr:family 20 glycosylhydrolase [Acidimicrobiales bacterium]